MDYEKKYQNVKDQKDSLVSAIEKVLKHGELDSVSKAWLEATLKGM